MTQDHTTETSERTLLGHVADHAVVALVAVPVVAQAAVLLTVVGAAQAGRSLRGLLRTA